FIFLFLENYGVRKLEAVFAVLIATMALSFAWMFGEAKPSGTELLIGILVPKLSSRTIKHMRKHTTHVNKTCHPPD
ncbi:hypothetical protein PRUPE_7G028200, partial [Prunus persica]